MKGLALKNQESPEFSRREYQKLTKALSFRAGMIDEI